MDGSDRSPVRPRGRPLLLIAVAVIVIVAVVAVAGAYVLTNNGPGTGSDDGNDFVNDDNDDTDVPDNTDNGTGADDPIGQFDLKVGDFVEFTANSELLGLTQTSIIRLTVTEVTSSGYDISMRMTAGSDVQESSFHANSTDELIAGVAGEGFSRGEMLGEGNLSTLYGVKRAEHWRTNIVTDASTNVTDYYVGVNTGMVYRIDIVSTGNDLLRLTTTTMAVLTDTNIDAVRTGDPA